MSTLHAAARGLIVCLALGLTGGASFAQAKPTDPPAPPRLADLPATAPAAAAPASAASASAKGHVRVIEDDNVRIEESKARGQTQRILVKDKTGVGLDYEILVTPGGKDLSRERGNSGQRAWSLFAF